LLRGRAETSRKQGRVLRLLRTLASRPPAGRPLLLRLAPRARQPAATTRGERPLTGRLLTCRQVADWLGITVETVLRWHRRGELPGFKLPGGAIRFREDDLEAWLEAHATGAATEKTPVNRHRAQTEVSLVSPVNPPQTAAQTEKETSCIGSDDHPSLR
jgi:excisionase family DNA binding protein